MSKETPFVNVLLLGECGVGKSTFINSFANYIKYDTLSKALRGKLEYRIPQQFYAFENAITIGELKKIDPFGRSNTEVVDVTDYVFDVKNVKFRLINAPDINAQHYKEVLDTTLTQVTKYGHLHAIGFVLSWHLDMNKEFKEFLDHLLLKYINKSTSQLIYIFPQHPTSEIFQNTTFWCRKTGIQIPSYNKNMFIFNTSKFRLLAAHFQGVTSAQITLKAHEDTWTESALCCKNFIDYVVGGQIISAKNVSFKNTPMETRNQTTNTLINEIKMLKQQNRKLLDQQEILRQEICILRYGLSKKNSNSIENARVKQIEHNQTLINEQMYDVYKDMKSVKEFLQILSIEFRNFKRQLSTNKNPSQSTSTNKNKIFQAIPEEQQTNLQKQIAENLQKFQEIEMLKMKKN